MHDVTVFRVLLILSFIFLLERFDSSWDYQARIVVVFDINDPRNLRRIMFGEKIGTLVTNYGGTATFVR